MGEVLGGAAGRHGDRAGKLLEEQAPPQSVRERVGTDQVGVHREDGELVALDARDDVTGPRFLLEDLGVATQPRLTLTSRSRSRSWSWSRFVPGARDDVGHFQHDNAASNSEAPTTALLESQHLLEATAVAQPGHLPVAARPAF